MTRDYSKLLPSTPKHVAGHLNKCLGACMITTGHLHRRPWATQHQILWGKVTLIFQRLINRWWYRSPRAVNIVTTRLQLPSQLSSSSTRMVISSRGNSFAHNESLTCGASRDPVHFVADLSAHACTCATRWAKAQVQIGPNWLDKTARRDLITRDWNVWVLLQEAVGSGRVSSSWCLGGRGNKNGDAVVQESETSATTHSLPSGGLQKERIF